MVRYLPSDAALFEGVFHNDPSDPHSASSHTDVADPSVEQRLLAVEPAPVGAVVDVVMLILSSRAPSSRYAKVSVWFPALRLNVFGNCAQVHDVAAILFHVVQAAPSILTHHESSSAVGVKTRANTLYVPLWLTLNEKSIYPALFVGALAVLLLPD
jgi:hypothetical protein